MEKWKEEAQRLRFDEHKRWTEIGEALQEYFPDKTLAQVTDKARIYIIRLPEYKESKKSDFKNSSIEYRKDGSVISEKFITVRDGDEMTPEFLIEAHGLKPSAWEVTSYKNNLWNSQLKGGIKQISYQSKLTVKPKTDGLSFADIDAHFKQLDREFKPLPILYKPGNKTMMAEVNTADLHLGKLCWHGDTPENFDHKIAKDMFYDLIQRIGAELKEKDIEYITFVWANDFFNSDTASQTTTGGTPQDTDIRERKLFNVGVEMLVNGITSLSEIAPVKTFYTPSNHDEMCGYHALKYLEAWFRQDPNVEIDTSAYPRKYILYGNTLIGFTHGDKENSNGNKEKASRLASLMPNETPKLWGESKYREMHAAHLHSEQMIQEINGVIVRRISSPTASDTWHTENGYIGAVRKAQVFLYDKELGNLQTINVPVRG